MTSPVAPTRLEHAVRDATERFSSANPASQARFEEAAAHLPGADTRTVNFYDPFPVTIVEGAGARITDLDGHEYLDFLGDYTAGLYGHSNPVLQAALVEAVGKGLTFGGPNPNQHELAALMCERFPSVDRVRFTNSGTEANLMAISLARAATGREKVLVFEGGYHGGVLDFTGPDRRVNVPFQWLSAEYNDLESATEQVRRHGSDLAAILVEPMLGGGGCIPGDPEFLSGLRAAADEVGAILIFDEVQTSRIGPGGLQSVLGIHADLTAFGKYLGGGASFGAFGGRADLMDRFNPRREDHLHHAGTHNNNVLTLAAGVAGLRDVYTSDRAVDLTARGDALRERLNAIGRAHEAPVQVTGCGSIMTVHFQREPIVSRHDVALTPPAARDLFHLEMMLAGIYVARRGFMTVMLAHTEDDCDRLCAEFATFIEANGETIEAA